jgi:hypothetical protein
MKDPMSDDTRHMKDIPTIRQGVMDVIKKRGVQMRPRWHFVLTSMLASLGIFIVLLALLYIISLSLFLLHDSGAWSAASFGGRGWFSLLRSVPWLLIAFSIVFIVILEVLVRRYRFVYSRPLLLSVVAILLVVCLGGFILASTSFHRQMELEAYHHQLAGPLALVYSAPFRMPPPPDVYHGSILATSSEGFVMNDENGAGTTTVIITARTHLPDGEDFSLGSYVVVIGDTVSTGTVQAFGMRETDE